MLNEWQEFLDYTGSVTYVASGKNDTTYLGRFTFDTLLDFEGLARMLTILARGYLFHGADGSVLHGNPCDRIDYARRALSAWCSVPDRKTATPKKTWPFKTDLGTCTRSFLIWWMKMVLAGFVDMSMLWRGLSRKILEKCARLHWIRQGSLRKSLTQRGGIRYCNTRLPFSPRRPKVPGRYGLMM